MNLDTVLIDLLHKGVEQPFSLEFGMAVAVVPVRDGGMGPSGAHDGVDACALREVPLATVLGVSAAEGQRPMGLGPGAVHEPDGGELFSVVNLHAILQPGVWVSRGPGRTQNAHEVYPLSRASGRPRA